MDNIARRVRVVLFLMTRRNRFGANTRKCIERMAIAILFAEKQQRRKQQQQQRPHRDYVNSLWVYVSECENCEYVCVDKNGNTRRKKKWNIVCYFFQYSTHNTRTLIYNILAHRPAELERVAPE